MVKIGGDASSLLVEDENIFAAGPLSMEKRGGDIDSLSVEDQDVPDFQGQNMGPLLMEQQGIGDGNLVSIKEKAPWYKGKLSEPFCIDLEVVYKYRSSNQSSFQMSIEGKS